MRTLLVLLTSCFLTGCLTSGRDPLVLGPEWAPLEAIHERPALLRDVGSKTAIVTVGHYAYVRDLDDWLDNRPVGSPGFVSRVRHEQEHSKRQLAAGTWLWIARYSYDKSFALLEEKIGYYYEILEDLRLGNNVDPVFYADVLSGYKILTGPLISFEDALDWVYDVIDGRWTPPSE